MPHPALVLVLEEPRLTEIRDRFDPSAAGEGMPVHLTLLYPFGGDRAAAREVVAAHAPQQFELIRLGVVPERGFAALYAEPRPELLALMRALWERFPEWPPSGGAVADPEPFVALARGGPDPELAEAVEPLLPVECRVDAVTVLEQDEPGRWREGERLPLDGP